MNGRDFRSLNWKKEREKNEFIWVTIFISSKAAIFTNLVNLFSDF